MSQADGVWKIEFVYVHMIPNLQLRPYLSVKLLRNIITSMASKSSTVSESESLIEDMMYLCWTYAEIKELPFLLYKSRSSCPYTLGGLYGVECRQQILPAPFRHQMGRGPFDKSMKNCTNHFIPGHFHIIQENSYIRFFFEKREKPLTYY